MVRELRRIIKETNKHANATISTKRKLSLDQDDMATESPLKQLPKTTEKQTKGKKMESLGEIMDQVLPGCSGEQNKTNSKNKNGKGKTLKDQLGSLSAERACKDQLKVRSRNKAKASEQNDLIQTYVEEDTLEEQEDGFVPDYDNFSQGIEDGELDQSLSSEEGESYLDNESDDEVQIKKIPKEKLVKVEMEQIQENPALMNVMQLMVNRAVGAAKAQWEGELAKKQKTKELDQTGREHLNNDLIKSPSDTTLYAPALGRKLPLQDEIDLGNTGHKDNAWFINDISTFIESVRLGVKNQQTGNKCNTPENRMDSRSESGNDETDRKFLEAQDKVKDMVVQAEQFRAIVNKQPKGKSNNLLLEDKLGDNGLSDDDFFHVTCHVDEGLMSKIENGEFIELEKLLPKLRSKQLEGKMELIN